MSLARVGRILARWWLFIVAVTLAALVGSILWQAFGPVPFRAEAELLLALNIPPDSQDRQFGIESSRAQASGVVIEDLVRLARGRELLREAYERVIAQGYEMGFKEAFDTLAVFSFARGLRMELDWSDPKGGQALIDALVDLLLQNQFEYYPGLREVGTLQLIDKTDEPTRPPMPVATLDVAVKTLAAVLLALIVALLVDWRANRLYAADIPELLEMPVIGSIR